MFEGVRIPKDLLEMMDEMERQFADAQERRSRELFGMPAGYWPRWSDPPSDPWADIRALMDSVYERRNERLEALEACAMDLFACLSEPGCRAEDAVIYTWEHPTDRHGFAFAAYKGERVGPGRMWHGTSGLSLTN